MENLIIEVFEKNHCPKLTPCRGIEIEDFANVDERQNALLFILEDDKGWMLTGKMAILKIRFRLADEMKEKLDKYLSDATLKSYAMNLWKVHRFEVKKDESTPEKEDELKGVVKKLIEYSIQMINYKADSSF
jgi:hypothetical protein